MENYDLKYFKIAKALNTENYEELKRRKLHFRGNFNSFSLISLNKETVEKGKPKLTTKEAGLKELQKIILEKNLRPVPEKELQAWIINYAMNNRWKLPFGNNLFFLTSEIAFPIANKKKVVNDILAIDNEGNLVVIELKPIRVNKVKEQAENFAKIINENHSLFIDLVNNVLTEKKWNKEIKKIAVWPKLSTENKPKENKFPNIQEINYIKENGTYHFE